MQLIVEGLAIILLIVGMFFFFVGVVGLIRMPDVFSRMHATTKCDTMGAGCIYLGLMIWQGFNFYSLNIFLVLLFIWLTNPTAAHVIAKSAYYQMKDTKDQ